MGLIRRLILISISTILLLSIKHTIFTTLGKSNDVYFSEVNQEYNAENNRFNEIVVSVQNIANTELNQIEKTGYLSDTEKYKIKNEIESEDDSINCSVSGTSNKVNPGSTVFLNIEIYTENTYGAKLNQKNIFVTGDAT